MDVPLFPPRFLAVHCVRVLLVAGTLSLSLLDLLYSEDMMDTESRKCHLVIDDKERDAKESTT